MPHSDRVINISRTNIQSYKVVAESICHYMGAKCEHRWGDIDAYTEAVKRTLSSSSSVDYTALESRFGGHIVNTLEGYLH